MKLKITESQLQTIKRKLTEEVVSDSNYNRMVKLSFNSKATYNGMEISNISDETIKITYDIDLEVRHWGIKGIIVYNVKGPSDITIDIETYNVNDEAETNSIPLKLDWDNVEYVSYQDEGVITVSDEIEVFLTNNNNGDIIVEKINVTTYNL
jgi:hypothetical protein